VGRVTSYEPVLNKYFNKNNILKVCQPKSIAVIVLLYQYKGLEFFT
jgi:hypothetical protein